MSDHTHIEWTDATWNIITGCSVISPGCTNCYAMKLAGTRLQHHPSRAGLTNNSNAGPVWNGQVRFNEQWLLQPMSWTKPRLIFVCAHGDLFHENVQPEWLDKIFAVMARARHHTFQVLTKRADLMHAYLTHPRRQLKVLEAAANTPPLGMEWCQWPLPNVWLGVSAEDQQRADARIDLLMRTPAAVRWVSAEPLLGAIDLPRYVGLMKPVQGDFPIGHKAIAAPGVHRVKRNKYGARSVLASNGTWLGIKPEECCDFDIDWLVAGGESGPGARPMHADWARGLRDQCVDAAIPFFFKQWGNFIDASQDECPLGPPWSDWQWADGNSLQPGDGQRAMPLFRRVGKKAAGRWLDGVEWSQWPEVKS